MYLLDTNSISNYLDQRRQHGTLQQRIGDQLVGTVFISVISLEEILKGALASINKTRQQPTLIANYQRLTILFNGLHQFPLLPYTEQADQLYQSLPSVIKRIGTQDCRIAAIASTTGMTIITSNTNDFQRITLAPIEDWTH